MSDRCESGRPSHAIGNGCSFFLAHVLVGEPVPIPIKSERAFADMRHVRLL
jgi:hypothetical protein